MSHAYMATSDSSMMQVYVHYIAKWNKATPNHCVVSQSPLISTHINLPTAYTAYGHQ